MSVGKDFIGPYQLLRMISARSSTQVWEAVRSGEKKRIALKVLTSRYRKDNKAIEQIEHETILCPLICKPLVLDIFLI